MQPAVMAALVGPVRSTLAPMHTEATFMLIICCLGQVNTLLSCYRLAGRMCMLRSAATPPHKPRHLLQRRLIILQAALEHQFLIGL